MFMSFDLILLCLRKCILRKRDIEHFQKVSFDKKLLRSEQNFTFLYTILNLSNI